MQQQQQLRAGVHSRGGRQVVGVVVQFSSQFGGWLWIECSSYRKLEQYSRGWVGWGE
jgi:hypothetical protein